ncbi:hypothetical protein R2B67_17975 [Streptomyces cyaneofuscatus]|uniref:hypothetical protein n=1 Tax=Streptomyces cyaneofuscatus TaxID=66883 RepID=UPI0029539B59|nr:hypothetical protein [Streptomyces cyaneofuscatus]WOP10312.1 hypothetical protein R2B67_17975 [Streptomyces cyaneofuscatus]
MRTRTTAADVTGAALLLALVACDPAAEPTTESKPSAPTSSQPAGLTAKTAATGLADATGVKTLGDPTDARLAARRRPRARSRTRTTAPH